MGTSLAARLGNPVSKKKLNENRKKKIYAEMTPVLKKGKVLGGGCNLGITSPSSPVHQPPPIHLEWRAI